MLFLLAMLCVALLTACEDLPQLPQKFEYEVDFLDEGPAPSNREALVGWSVVANGKTLGVIEKSEFGPRLTMEASAQPTIESLFHGAELQSPCGKRIKLKKPITSMWKDPDGKLADEKMSERKLYKFHLRDLAEKRAGVGPLMTVGLSAYPAEFPAGLTSHPVLIARGGVTSALTIGPMTVELAVNRIEVPSECGDDLPVKVGGKEIGVWSSKSGATFIAVAADACFADRVITYGENPYASTNKILRGPGVFALNVEPDYFLTKAPVSIGVVQGTRTGTRSELDFAPCPP